VSTLAVVVLAIRNKGSDWERKGTWQMDDDEKDD
jgi:hypothetical protein